MVELDPIGAIIFWVTILFLTGVIGRTIAIHLKQPGVLGELVAGIILGNVLFFMGSHLALLLREGNSAFSIVQLIISGENVAKAVQQVIPNAKTAKEFVHILIQSNANDLLRVTTVLDVFSRYGIIFVLFMVGVESSLAQLRHTGKEAISVAFIGVIMPIAFGIIVTILLIPNISFSSHLFIAATLCATSVGVTARVLKEMNILKRRESQTILGAAVIDDILGLIILAIVSSLVISGSLDFKHLGLILLNTVLFFMIAFVAGTWILRGLNFVFKSLIPWEGKLLVSFVFLMCLSWLATFFNLASIIGAFTAGVIIKEEYFNHQGKDPRNHLTVHELLSPVEFILAPLFFVLIGMQVKLENFCDLKVILLGVALICAAILGKLMSGLGAHKKDNRLFVGIGMMPRGEVGLVFASVGATLGVISDQIFTAIILMVIVTTLLTPPLLSYRYNQSRDH